MLEKDTIDIESEGIAVDASLAGPYDVTLGHAPDGGWAVEVRWEYGYRTDEVDHFEIIRKSSEGDEWVLVRDDLSSEERTCTDLLPGNDACSYRVVAVTHDGQRLESPDPLGADATTPGGYISPDLETAKPTGIRKPLASTSEKVFIAWDHHPQASGYLLEALDDQGESYLKAWVADPLMPLGLLVGRHPTGHFTARVAVLRRGADGRSYIASSTKRRIDLDDACAPHLTVYDFFVQEPDFAANRTHGVVLGLAQGKQPDSIFINGVAHPGGWIKHGEHFSATIQYVSPVAAGVTATLCTSVPSNAH